MSFVLLDLAKLGKVKKIPYSYAKVGLMVTLKQAKKLTTPDEPHAVYVLPEKKAAASIIQAALDILLAHPDEQLAIVSPRAKLRAAVANWQNEYPQAQIAHFNKAGKKLKKFLSTQTNLAENQGETAEQAQQHAEEQCIKKGMARSQEIERAHVFTLMEQTSNTNQTDSEQQQEEHKEDPEIEAALLLFKKNRPKKKSDLVRLLSHTPLSSDNMQELVVKLQEQGYIQIDAAENVRYQ